MNADTLDLRRLLCPLPVMRMQDRTAGMSDGDLLTVLCTDPGLLNDVPAWCKMSEHEILQTQCVGAEISFMIRVSRED